MTLAQSALKQTQNRHRPCSCIFMRLRERQRGGNKSTQNPLKEAEAKDKQCREKRKEEKRKFDGNEGTSSFEQRCVQKDFVLKNSFKILF